MRRLLFVPGANSRASFVRSDLEVLRSRFDVLVVPSPHGSFSRLRPFFRTAWALFREDVDLVFVWFAAVSYAPWISLMARLLGVPVVIVSGGADVANQPEIGFGDARVRWRRWLISRTLESVALVLPFSESARREVLAIAPRATTRVIAPAVRIPHCREEKALAPRIVLTVSAVTPVTLAQKGLETFVRAAAHLPDVRFILVGDHSHAASVDRLRTYASDNVELRGGVDERELHALFCAAHVYVQVSSHEGFGLAVVEAMAAGCHPVVTDRGSLPEVVGDRGRYVPYGDARATAAAIREALQEPPRAAQADDFENRYGLERRDRELASALMPLLGDAQRATLEGHR